MTGTTPPAMRRPAGPWLFSRTRDLAAFGGSALLSLLLCALGAFAWSPLGPVNETPAAVWLCCVLLVDVAHVWGNLVLVYLDPRELRRRPVLYAGVPVAVFVMAAALASESEALFWRALAYLAVLHFVRQQVGFVALYRVRAGDTARVSRFIDDAAIYSATLAPVVWWHAHLPRQFSWFVDGDFAGGLSPMCGTAALALEACALVAYAASSITRARAGAPQWGKDLVVGSTALLWWLGIVALDADFAFTVTNVLIHGIPYIALIAWTAEQRRARALFVARPLRHGLLVLVATLWTFALVEEVLWDRLLWHERGWLSFNLLPAFDGLAADAGDNATARTLVLALLVLPQAVHYVLDGFIWRRANNAVLAHAVQP